MTLFRWFRVRRNVRRTLEIAMAPTPEPEQSTCAWSPELVRVVHVDTCRFGARECDLYSPALPQS